MTISVSRLYVPLEWTAYVLTRCNVNFAKLSAVPALASKAISESNVNEAVNESRNRDDWTAHFDVVSQT
jgi:type II secretory pathway component PulK